MKKKAAKTPAPKATVKEITFRLKTTASAKRVQEWARWWLEDFFGEPVDRAHDFTTGLSDPSARFVSKPRATDVGSR